jgi:hypothetical protein
MILTITLLSLYSLKHSEVMTVVWQATCCPRVSLFVCIVNINTIMWLHVFGRDNPEEGWMQSKIFGILIINWYLCICCFTFTVVTRNDSATVWIGMWKTINSRLQGVIFSHSLFRFHVQFVNKQNIILFKYPKWTKKNLQISVYPYTG